MFKFLFKLFASITFIFFIFYQNLNAQQVEIQSRGVEKDHFVSIKSHKITLDEKLPYMFSQLSEYKIVIKDQKEKTDYYMAIYDEVGRELITNYDHKSKKYVHQVFFNCPATKTYYMRFEKKQH